MENHFLNIEKLINDKPINENNIFNTVEVVANVEKHFNAYSKKHFLPCHESIDSNIIY